MLPRHKGTHGEPVKSSCFNRTRVTVRPPVSGGAAGRGSLGAGRKEGGWRLGVWKAECGLEGWTAGRLDSWSPGHGAPHTTPPPTDLGELGRLRAGRGQSRELEKSTLWLAGARPSTGEGWETREGPRGAGRVESGPPQGASSQVPGTRYQAAVSPHP